MGWCKEIVMEWGNMKSLKKWGNVKTCNGKIKYREKGMELGNIRRI